MEMILLFACAMFFSLGIEVLYSGFVKDDMRLRISGSLFTFVAICTVVLVLHK
jgi:hypothetical protein